MPNRLIKESLISSPTIQKLSAEEERHFVRILLAVDDHGCLEVTPAILRARCYPLLCEVISSDDVAEWTRKLEAHGLIQTWEESGRHWGVVKKFNDHSGQAFTDEGKRTRNRRKTPIPPSDLTTGKRAKRSQTEPDGATCRPVSVSVSVPVPVSNQSMNEENIRKRGRTTVFDQEAEIQTMLGRYQAGQSDFDPDEEDAGNFRRAIMQVLSGVRPAGKLLFLRELAQFERLQVCIAAHHWLEMDEAPKGDRKKYFMGIVKGSAAVDYIKYGDRIDRRDERRDVAKRKERSDSGLVPVADHLGDIESYL